ncbi:MAG: FAD-dependent oxidoreductase [Myxococcota bacterium]|jgi:hypothetical protein|nr:FAD-dependent oxidoreductase [Myxococcota bacterium]
MLLRIFVFAVILTEINVSFAQTRFDHETRIAIVGAGASGLTCAFHLKKLGYENISVYEKEPRVGGKVYSYPYDDYVYELGAFWTTKSSKTVLEMADYYGIEPVSEEADFLVLKANGKTYGFEDNLFKNYNLFEISFALLNFEKTRAKFGKDLSKIGYDDIHPDLYLPFGTFIKKYRIAPLAYAFRPFWIGCGYGYYETTPALYVMKLMVPSIVDTLSQMFKRANPFSGGEKNSGLLRFPNGYQGVFESVAGDVPDLRLDSEVTRVERALDNGKLVIRITANGHTDEFDKVIISTDLRAALSFLDVVEEEEELFSSVESYNLHIKLVEADGINQPLDSMLWFDEYGTIDTIGHMTTLVNRSAVPEVYFTAQLIPWGTSSAQIDEWMEEDIRRVGGEVTEYVVEQSWNYFPYVGEQALRDGFYERMNNLQGERGTYFVGGVLNFETVEYTAVFAKDLVLRNF